MRDCQKALVAQTKAGGEGRPNACRNVKDDDGNVNDRIGGSHRALDEFVQATLTEDDG